MLKARETVRNLKEYHPPLGRREGLRFDFNENVGGCSPRVLAVLASLSTEVLNKYPEREVGERAVSASLGIAIEKLLLTNGVDEAIHLLCETYLEPGDEALTVVPTFSLYEIYAAATGAKTVAVQAGEDFFFPAEKVLRAITPATKLIMLATPNNPTGAVASRRDLLAIAAAAPQAALLVDEAYWHFDGATIIDQVGSVPNLFVARTFSKVYGLAGFRVGILAGAAEQMKQVRRVSSPYNVNGVALACLAEALADREFVSNYVNQVVESRARLEKFYAERGIRFWPSRANFVLAWFGDFRQPLVAEMRRRGVLVRDRNSDPGCAGCVRITVGPREQTDRLLKELGATLEAISFQPDGKIRAAEARQ
ncbi:MAG: histidinol-phosphate transaminase [Candidatus Korobacteraceae bacterium]